ncbi:MAG: hypothetical protein WD038_05240 [Balneolales bacterium]
MEYKVFFDGRKELDEKWDGWRKRHPIDRSIEHKQIFVASGCMKETIRSVCTIQFHFLI